MSRLADIIGFPLCLRLSGKQVVVVGGGAVAGRKVRALVAAGAQVHVIAPLLGAELQALADSGRIRWSARPFEPGDLHSAWLAVASTDDPAVNRLVVGAGESSQVWVISVTDESPATTMAVARRGALSVAVGTGGESPAVAVWVRDQLEAVLEPELGSLLEMAAAVRASLADEGKSPSAPDWRRALDSGMLDLIRAGRIDEARGWLRSCLLSSLA